MNKKVMLIFVILIFAIILICGNLFIEKNSNNEIDNNENNDVVENNNSNRMTMQIKENEIEGMQNSEISEGEIF